LGIRIREFAHREQAAEALAGALQAALGAALAKRDTASLVVSGGSSPVGLFRRLRAKPLRWSRVTVLASDERDVPPGHPDRNEGMIRRELLQEAAGAARLVSLIPPGPIPAHFDAVVLGMGADGHTASLFPGSPDLAAALASPDRLATLRVPRLDSRRVSLTPAALLGSAAINLLFFGADKRTVFDAARAGDDRHEFPVRVILGQDTVPVTVYTAP
jgi:6-phosphogluconolactonase